MFIYRLTCHVVNKALGSLKSVESFATRSAWSWSMQRPLVINHGEPGAGRLSLISFIRYKCSQEVKLFLGCKKTWRDCHFRKRNV